MGVLKEGRLRDIYVPVVFFLLVLVGAAIAAQVGPNRLTVAVIIGNTAPIVFNANVALNGSVTLAERGTAVFMVKFNVTDADGTGNINNARAGVNITYNGINRANNSGNCENLGDSDSTTRLFSCNVTFNYFDNATSLWEINLSAADNNGAIATNDSRSSGNANGGAGHNLTINSLSAFAIAINSTATSASLGDTNKEISFVVNNTGNFDFTLINVTPFVLNASFTDIFALNGNFSINATASTASGFGSNLQNATPRNFTGSQDEVSATLPHRTTGGDGDDKGNRTLYIYIDVPSTKGLSTGVTYNSSRPWEIFTS